MPKPTTETSKMKTLQREMKNLNKRGLRAGTKIVLKDVRARVVKKTGALKKSLTSKVDSFKGEVSAYGIVGPKSKFTMQVGTQIKKPSRYAHFIERGKFARPFLMPTWLANKDNFLKAVAKVIGEGMQKVINA